jgi:hypothetical protein
LWLWLLWLLLLMLLLLLSMHEKCLAAQQQDLSLAYVEVLPRCSGKCTHDTQESWHFGRPGQENLGVISKLVAGKAHTQHIDTDPFLLQKPKECFCHTKIQWWGQGAPLAHTSLEFLRG